MKTEVKFAELHQGVFIAGTNLEKKLDPHKRHGLKLSFDEETRHLYVTWKDQTTRVPEANVAYFTEGQVVIEESKVNPGTVMVGTRPQAQVSTPQSHVHAGAGHGKVGK